MIYEPIPVKFFVDFWDYFGHFSIKISGVIYSGGITPETLSRKLAQKNPKINEKFYWDRFFYTYIQRF